MSEYTKALLWLLNSLVGTVSLIGFLAASLLERPYYMAFFGVLFLSAEIRNVADRLSEVQR